jgi:ribonuclease HIII
VTETKQSFAFEDRPHQISLARRPGAAVSLYNNGKIVIAGNNIALIDPLREFLVSLDAEEAAKQEDHLPPLELPFLYIGVRGLVHCFILRSTHI